MYSSSTSDPRLAVNSTSMPRFLTSAPLMFHFSGTDSGLTPRNLSGNMAHQFGTQSRLGSIHQQPIFPSITSSIPRLFPGINAFNYPSIGGIGASSAVPSPYASSSVLGGPISTFTSPGSTLTNLQLVAPAKPSGAAVVTPRGPLGEINQNRVPNLNNDRPKSSPWELMKPVSQASFQESSFDHLNITLSSPADTSRRSEAGKPWNAVRPRGEFVGLRVTEIEDHLRRQSVHKPPSSTMPLKSGISN